MQLDLSLGFSDERGFEDRSRQKFCPCQRFVIFQGSIPDQGSLEKTCSYIFTFSSVACFFSSRNSLLHVPYNFIQPLLLAHSVDTCHQNSSLRFGPIILENLWRLFSPRIPVSSVNTKNMESSLFEPRQS